MFRSLLSKLLKSYPRGSKSTSLSKDVSPAKLHTDQNSQVTRIQSPVETYYKHRATNELADFRRFALQSRSLVIRDVFARAATSSAQGLNDLLAIIEHCHCDTEVDFESEFDAEVLLTLADLLANGAKGDLDTHGALQIFDFVYGALGSEVFADHQKLQYLEALGEAERFSDIDRRANEFSIRELAPLQYELLNLQRVRASRTSSTDWLNALNALYESLNMSRISLIDDESCPLMDRLQSDTRERLWGPRVSVIMPTYSPGPGIWTAIRSLLEQTWQNVEIIIVDDASPREFDGLFLELERFDPKIRVVRNQVNAGAYVARNSGLALATGEYVTTHDDDDWSHPDKLAVQAGVLARNENVVATTSAHIRTTQDMVLQRVNIDARYMQMNYSSLMFRKAAVAEVGPWDTVNRGGDSEFLTRMAENFGSDRIAHLNEKPLSFSRVWDGSLTSSEMYRGYFAYSRLLYRWSFRQWHWKVRKLGDKPVQGLDSLRPYAVPSTFEPGMRNADLGFFDVIYASDFFRQSKFVEFVMNDVETLASSGFRVGFVHLNSPQTSRPAGFPPKLFSMQQSGRITQVSQDDTAEAQLLIVYDASIGMFLDEVASSVVSHKSIVIHHELPTLSGAGPRSAVFMGQALKYIDTTFRNKFQVVGATISDQHFLRERVPKERLLPDKMIWSPHVEREMGEVEPPQATPIVGFHTYGNIYRWPSSKDDFSRVYISSEYRTRFYGHTKAAQNKFGREKFECVDVVTPDQQDEREFLKGVDFWVYYPNHRLQDQVSTPVLSALQAGKVVILPKRLEPIYGAAAVYADAEDVEGVITHLCSDRRSYIQQARRGQKFVAEFHTQDNLLERIRSLV